MSHAAVGYWAERDAEPTDAYLAPLAALLADRLAWHPAIAGLNVAVATPAGALGRSRRRTAPTPA